VAAGHIVVERRLGCSDRRRLLRHSLRAVLLCARAAQRNPLSRHFIDVRGLHISLRQHPPHGNLDGLAPRLSPPRLAQLQREVEARTAELAQVNQQLRAEITARDLAETQLLEQDRRKDEFLATLAHELRNPLAPIHHAIRLLGAEHSTAEQQRWGREVIDRQAHRMALLLDDLLDVARITRGRLEIKKEHVDLAALIVEVDPLLLSQAVSNLLTNAAKYTPRGGTITLSVALEAEALTITVADTGAGFDPSIVPAMFEMFSQADSGIQDAGGGLGIGLSLVKGLIQLHGGTVTASSAGKGRGSEFTITLPRSVVVTHSAPMNSVQGSSGTGAGLRAHTPRRRQSRRGRQYGHAARTQRT